MRSDEFVPFPKKHRKDIIFEKLEELIEGGHWKPGEQILTEAELSSRFNVGRSTVREALNRLKAQGLICSTPGRGTFVKFPPSPEPTLLRSLISGPITRAELLEIMDYRFAIEPAIAALASLHATKEEIAELQRLTDKIRDNPLQGSDVFAEADLQFHVLIAETSRNGLLLESMRIAAPSLMKQHILTASVPEMRPMGPRYHYQLIEALEEHLPRKAEAIMRAHIDETYHYVRKIMI